MMDKRRVTWLLTGMVCVLLIALAATELGANLHRPTPTQSMITAQDLPSNHAETVDGKPETGGGLVPAGSALLEPPPPSPKNPNADDEDPGDEEPEEEKTTVVERHTIWKILFPYETLGESVQAAIGKMIMEAAEDITAQVRDGISGIANTVINNTDFTKGIRKVRRDVWKVGIVIAGILMPLSFMVSVVSALKDGTTSVTGYANAREALINWVVAAGAAVSSYFILDKIIELSSAAMTAIFSGLLRTAINNFSLGDYFNGVLLEALVMSNPSGAQILLAVFGMLLALALLTSIGLAFMAREVILILAVGVAPVMLVMGSVGPLRWLNGLWLKVTTVAMLLGPANAFLIGSSALLALNARQSGLDLNGMGGRIIGYLIALGIISVLIGLNTIIGKMVYGAVIEIAEKALNGIMVAAGAIVGTAAMGALGGVGAAASGSTAASTASGIGSLSKVSSAKHAVGAIGEAAKAMGIPGARGFSAGMNLGSSFEAHGQVKQGIAQATEAREQERQEREEKWEARNAQLDQRYQERTALAEARDRVRTHGEPWENANLNMSKAIQSARSSLSSEFANGSAADVLRRTGLAPPELNHRIEHGTGLMEAGNTVAQLHNVNMKAGLRQMNYGVSNIQDAAVADSRAIISHASLGDRSPYTLQKPWRNLPNEYTWADVHTAMVVAANRRDIDFQGSAGVNLVDGLTQAIYQRRTQSKESLSSIQADATKAADLNLWMRNSYQKLPDQRAADGLGKILGF